MKNDKLNWCVFKKTVGSFCQFNLNPLLLFFLVLQIPQVFNLCQGQCTVSISAQPSQTICIGQSTTLTANPAGMAPYSYLWSTNAVTSSILVNSPGSYTVTITDANECLASTSIEVFSQTVPSVGVSVTGPSSGCLPLLVMFNIINFSQNDSTTIYSLDFGDGTAPVMMTHQQLLLNSMVSHTYISPSAGLPGNMFVFQVNAANGCGSTNAMVSPIFVYNHPLPYNITGGGSYCQGGTGVPIGLNDTQAGVTYQLFRNNVAVLPPMAGTGGPLFFGQFTEPGIYTIVGTNMGTNCSSTMNGSVTISVDPLPVADAGPDQAIPYGVSTTLNGFALGGTGLLTFSWSPANLLTTGIYTLTPGTTLLTTTTTYTLLVTDSKGCMASDQTSVFVFGPPLGVSCSASSPGAVCYGTSVQLFAAATGGSGSYTYLWSSAPTGSPAWSSSLANPVVMPLTSTTYTVVVSDGFSQSSCNITITVNPIPTVLQPPPQSVCSGSATSPVYLSSTVPGTTFSWVASASPSLIGYLASGTGNIPSQVILNTANNAGVVTYMITPVFNGCAGPIKSFSITVFPVPAAFITGDTAVCTGNSYTYSAPPGMGNYSWSISAGGVILSNNINQLTVLWLTPGMQTVSLSVYSSFGCVTLNPSVLPVSVHPPLSGQQVLNNITVAAGQSFCQASGSIWAGNSGFTVDSGGQAKLIASGGISLLPGVHAALGSSFSALAGHCQPCATSKFREGDNRISDNILQDGFSRQIPGKGMIFIYPNPAEDHFSITFPADGTKYREPVNVAVIDASGRQLIAREFREISACTISLQGFSPGVYLVRVTAGNEVMVRRLVKTSR